MVLNFLGDMPKKTPKFPEILTLLLHVSLKIPQVTQFPAKSSDSQKKFAFLPKQPFLELTPHVTLDMGVPAWQWGGAGKNYA